MVKRKFVFADVETTGLNAQSDKLVELTYAVEDGPLTTLFFGVKSVPAYIDDLTKFSERRVYDEPSATPGQIEEFLEAMGDNTLVAANASFDRDFLKANNIWNGHYRLLELESYAMAKLGLDYVPSMKDIETILTRRGFVLTQPDHSSYNDTKALREAFNILRYM